MICEQMEAFKTTLGRRSISLDELLKIEKAIIVFGQRQRYSEKMAKLEKSSLAGKALNRQRSIYKLDLVLQGGVLQVGEKLNKSTMPDEIQPMILTKDHNISVLHICSAYACASNTCCNCNSVSLQFKQNLTQKKKLV